MIDIEAWIAEVNFEGAPIDQAVADARLLALARPLAAEVLELRTDLTAAAPAMAAMHSSAKEVWDEYEVIIDHLGDMVAARDTEVARLRADLEAAKADEQAWITATGIAVQERDIARAELESAREGRDYGC